MAGARLRPPRRRGVGRATLAAGAAAAAAAVAGGLLAGEVFVAVMGTGLGLGLAAVWALGARRAPAAAAVPPGRFWRRLLAAAGLAVAAGVAVGMVGVLPAARALGGTERGTGLAADYAELGSLHPARLLELAVAGGFGRPGSSARRRRGRARSSTGVRSA